MQFDCSQCRQKGFTPAYFLIGILVILTVADGAFYLGKISQKPKQSMAETNSAKGVYKWLKIGLVVYLPDNFYAENSIKYGGPPEDPDLPSEIKITRYPADGSFPSSSLTHSDFMYIEIFKLGDNLDKFIAEINQENKYRGFFLSDRNRKLIETSRISGTEARWFIATAKDSENDSSKDYEIYFIHKGYGFILRAEYSWDKNEATQILNGISFVN